jgi:hypothetical protein
LKRLLYRVVIGSIALRILDSWRAFRHQSIQYSKFLGERKLPPTLRPLRLSAKELLQ